MTDGFRRACLVTALVLGCAFAAFQILHDVRVPVQLLPGVAARVNGHPIDTDSVNRTVAGMDARVRQSEAATRHDVLTRMIDEELLVQRALDSGAAHTNPEVRAALVHSAITRVNSEAAAEPISDRELSQYFEAHKEVYATAASFDVTPVYFEAQETNAAGLASAAKTGLSAAADGTGQATTAPQSRAATAPRATGDVAAATGLASAAKTDLNIAADGAGQATTAPRSRAATERAAAARAALEGGASIAQIANTADLLPFTPPGSHVSPRTLANYFGPAIADAVAHLAVGHTTEVTQLGNGAVLIYLNNKTPGEVPRLSRIHDLVAADALRDRQERALEVLLASLRKSAHIEFATAPSPAPPVAATPRADDARGGARQHRG